jgi:hypothetical protein
MKRPDEQRSSAACGGCEPDGRPSSRRSIVKPRIVAHQLKRLHLLAALLVAALVAACGGGVGTGGTGSYGAAPVAGFGSIFVGGIEFDDARASVLDEDGTPRGAPALGATVEVEGGAVVDGADGPQATALGVRVARLVVGPVVDTEVGARRFTVLGQSVRVNGSTVFDASLHGGLAALKPGDVVSVHALAAAQGDAVATRVEPAASGEPWRLRGHVAALDTTAKQLRIGGATLDYGAAASVPAGLAEGRLVSVRLAGTSTMSVAAFDAVAAAPSEAARAEVEGLLSIASGGQALRIGATDIDATQASIEPAGATLAAGAQAQVEGRLRGGVLVATRIRLPSAQEIEHRTYQLAGRVESVDVAGASFVLRGVEVDFAGARFVGGSAASIVAGASLRVQGTLSSDGTRLDAKQIELR